VANTAKRDPDLERKMKLTRQAVSMGRALRVMHNLKIRQPLKALHLVTRDPNERNILIEMADIIQEELNVKEVIFRENEEELVEYKAQANYRVLGKQLGPHMKMAAERISRLTPKEIVSLMEGATLAFDLDGFSFDLTQEGVTIQRTEKENLKILNEGSLTVALDPELTDELVQEGIARDLVRGIQNQRKECDLNVTDRIKLYIYGPEAVKEVLANYEEYIMSETLAVSIAWEKHEAAAKITCGEGECEVTIQKAGV
jgi:isoleucyl-tRNA synthetase